MTYALYVGLGLVWFWAVGWLIVLACENRRERDIRACCPICTPSRTRTPFLVDAPVRPPAAERNRLPREAAGTFSKGAS